MAERERNIPDKFKGKTIYSFSRLSSFENCQRGYYYNYILKEKGEQNIFAHLGGSVHECLEETQKGNMSNDDVLKKLRAEMLRCDICNMKFSSDKVKKNFTESIEHYIKNYKPIKTSKFLIEEEFYVEIEGVVLVGYIDLIVFNEDGSIDVIDYKTSTKYDKKSIDKHGMQLVLYAMTLEQNQGLNINKIKWDMLKYCTVKWEGFSKPHKVMQRMCLRNEVVSKMKREIKKRFERIGTYSPIQIEMFIEESINKNSFDVLPDEVKEYFTVKNAYVEYPYNETTKQNLRIFIKNTTKEIEELDKINKEQWKPTDCDKQNFFCGNLCGHKKRCGHYHRYLKSIEETNKFKTKTNLAEQLFGRKL